MSRKSIIILLLFLSWVVINIHRAWNNTEPVYIKPFPLDAEYPTTWHWYVHTILKDISYGMVFLAAYLYINSTLKRDRDIIRTFKALLVIHVSDILHYIIAARHDERILALQGFCLLFTAAYTLYKKTYP